MRRSIRSLASEGTSFRWQDAICCTSVCAMETRSFPLLLCVVRAPAANFWQRLRTIVHVAASWNVPAQQRDAQDGDREHCTDREEESGGAGVAHHERTDEGTDHTANATHAL